MASQVPVNLEGDSDSDIKVKIITTIRIRCYVSQSTCSRLARLAFSLFS
jgi:hypothetical protein